jgi:UDP-N-acetylmuramate-alanine ligase
VVSIDHFRYELIGQLRRAAAEGAKTVVVNSAELCRSIRNANHSSQACCEAMQAEVKPGDTVLVQSSGSGMTVRYLLPRR